MRRNIRIQENEGITLTGLHRAIASLYGTKAFSGVTYRLLGGPEYVLELLLTEKHMDVVNLGFRFDTEEMAAILLNTKFNYKALGGSKFSLTARLNKNPYIRLDYALENPFLRRLNLAYMFRYNDFNLYDKGSKSNSITYRYHLGEASLSDLYFRNFKFQVGVRYEYFDYDPFYIRRIVRVRMPYRKDTLAILPWLIWKRMTENIIRPGDCLLRLLIRCIPIILSGWTDMLPVRL